MHIIAPETAETLEVTDIRFTHITTALCALPSTVLVRADFFERYYCHYANKDLVATAFPFMLISNRLKKTFHWAETCENKRQYERPPHSYTCQGEIKAENCVGMPDPLDYGCGRAMGNYHTNDWTSPSGHTKRMSTTVSSELTTASKPSTLEKVIS